MPRESVGVDAEKLHLGGGGGGGDGAAGMLSRRFALFACCVLLAAGGLGVAGVRSTRTLSRVAMEPGFSPLGVPGRRAHRGWERVRRADPVRCVGLKFGTPTSLEFIILLVPLF